MLPWWRWELLFNPDEVVDSDPLLLLNFHRHRASRARVSIINESYARILHCQDSGIYFGGVGKFGTSESL